MMRLNRQERSTGTSVRAAGFSVAELLVTVAIILIAAAIVTPTVKNSYNAYQFRSAVTATAGAIRAAHYQSIAQGYSYRLVFNSKTATYQLQKSAVTDPSGTGAFSNVGIASPISGASFTPALGADITLQFIPSGTVKLVSGPGPTLSSCSSTASPPPCTLSLTSRGNTETVSVSGYGTITITP